MVTVNAAYAKRARAGRARRRALRDEAGAASRELYLAHAIPSKAHLALHGKAAVFDREAVFVGSFNLDPRSSSLDTEAVFVVHSPALADSCSRPSPTDFAPANAWRIAPVAGKNKGAWITERPGRVRGRAARTGQPVALLRALVGAAAAGPSISRSNQLRSVSMRLQVDWTQPGTSDQK